MKKAKTLTGKTKSCMDVIQNFDLLGKTQTDSILLELKHNMYTFEELNIRPYQIS